MRTVNARTIRAVVLVALASSACGEAPSTGSEMAVEEGSNQIYSFFLDGKQVDEHAFTIGQDNLKVLIETGRNSENEIMVHAFSDVRDYFQYGKDNQMKLEETEKLAIELSQDAVASGAVDYYEKEGTMLPAYQLKHEQYLSQDRAYGVFPLTLYKDVAGGPAWVCLGNSAVMAPGWSNTVSRYLHVNIYGGVALYDKIFFSSHMATLWGWGNNYITFTGPLAYLNDKTSSLLTIL